MKNTQVSRRCPSHLLAVTAVANEWTAPGWPPLSISELDLDAAKPAWCRAWQPAWRPRFIGQPYIGRRELLARPLIERREPW